MIIDDFFSLSIEPHDFVPGCASGSLSAVLRAKEAYSKEGVEGSDAKDVLAQRVFKVAGAISDPSRAGGSDGQIGSGLYSLGFEQFEFEMIRCSAVQPKSVFSTQQNLGHHALKKRECLHERVRS